METIDMEIKNANPILSDLSKAIKEFDGSRHLYLNTSSDKEFINPGMPKYQLNSFGINESKLPVILKNLGIRSMTLDALPDIDTFLRLDALTSDDNGMQHRRNYLKNDLIREELNLLFHNCRTIAFDDWANIANASDLWFGLLADLIRPLKKTDLDFIFYLGDPGKMLFFQVDEILDIISDFSSQGRVTLIMDDNEANKLWMVLNGVRPGTAPMEDKPSDLKKKALSIFRTMSIHRLVVYSPEYALSLSSDEQFVFDRRKVDQEAEIAKEARDHFVAGFSMGLLLKLAITHCIALGLVVFEAHAENNSLDDRKSLLAYIDRWKTELEQPH